MHGPGWGWIRGLAGDRIRGLVTRIGWGWRAAVVVAVVLALTVAFAVSRLPRDVPGPGTQARDVADSVPDGPLVTSSVGVTSRRLAPGTSGLLVALVAAVSGYAQLRLRTEDLHRRLREVEDRGDIHALDITRASERIAGAGAQLDRVEAKLDRLIERR